MRGPFVAGVQNYPVRASHRARLNPAGLEASVRAHFGTAERDGDAVRASFGALERIVVRADGRELSVDVTMNPKVPEEVARDTIARYNRFLEETTGYSSKERARRLRKSAAAPGPGD
jgi:hypothetical protein